MASLSVKLAQLNFRISDFKANTVKIIDVIKRAKDADLLVFSELTLSGYAPFDAINEDWFLIQQGNAMQLVLEATKRLPDLYVALGYVGTRKGPGKAFTNSMLVAKDGEVLARYDKQLLPTYDIFDERRYFEPGDKPALIMDIKGTRVGFLVCEDGWNVAGKLYADNPITQATEAGAEIIVSLNASPSNLGKREVRERMFSETAATQGVLVIYVNQVGGNDQVIYDGHSFIADAAGNVLTMPGFIEGTGKVVLASGRVDEKSENLEKRAFLERDALYFEHIRQGLADYLTKTGFKKVIVGSSGGIDSAVTLAMAALTLGPERVEAITMPSEYSTSGSVSDSILLCRALGVNLIQFPIKNLIETAKEEYQQITGKSPTGLALENLQARMRGMLLMTRSNETGALLLTTGNKSELSVGYATLYGDMAGGLNLIGDLYKMEVYDLARYINQNFGSPIPEDIITKAPSAELAPGQRDEDSLPPYPVLDAVLKDIIENGLQTDEDIALIARDLYSRPIEEITELHARVSEMLAKAEYKRRQAAPVIRCRARAFGAGRVMPIAAAYR